MTVGQEHIEKSSIILFQENCLKREVKDRVLARKSCICTELLIRFKGGYCLLLDMT